MKSRRVRLTLSAFLILLPACGDEGLIEPEPEPDPPPPAQLVRVSPDSVHLEVRTSTDLAVKVLDEEGEPFEGARIRWSVAHGGYNVGATLITSDTLTDASGIARATIRAGSAVGPQVISVGSPDIEGSGFWFWLIIEPGPPVAMRIVRDTVAVWVGDTLAIELEFRDEDGNLTAPGTTIEWSSSDEGAVSVDADGRAVAHRERQAEVTARVGELSASAPAFGVEGPRFVHIVAGNAHTCALTEDGEAYCWGVDGTGQEADPRRTICHPEHTQATPCSLVPYRVPGGHSFGALDAGVKATCGMDGSGEPRCWGAGPALGMAGVESAIEPRRVAVGLHLVSVQAGHGFACGVTGAGEAYCWGRGRDGQLGHGIFEDSLDPVRVTGDLVFDTVAASSEVACGLTGGGTAYCWGGNWSGQLGAGWTSIPGEPEPTLVAGDHKFSALAIAEGTCALSESGDAYCWGFNSGPFSRFGNGVRGDTAVPVPVEGEHEWLVVSLGHLHGCGLTVGGRAYCWGSNGDGVLGTGGAPQAGSDFPVPVAGDREFVRIATGFTHTCAVTNLGRIYCWGSNHWGALGDGTVTRRSVPTPISPLPFVRAASHL